MVEYDFRVLSRTRIFLSFTHKQQNLQVDLKQRKNKSANMSTWWLILICSAAGQKTKSSIVSLRQNVQRLRFWISETERRICQSLQFFWIIPLGTTCIADTRLPRSYTTVWVMSCTFCKNKTLQGVFLQKQTHFIIWIFLKTEEQDTDEDWRAFFLKKRLILIQLREADNFIKVCV